MRQTASRVVMAVVACVALGVLVDAQQDIVAAVNRPVEPITFSRGTSVRKMAEEITRATVPGCKISLPGMLGVEGAIGVSRQPLLDTLRRLLAMAGLEVEFKVTGTLVSGSDTPKDCKISVSKKKEPGPGVYAITSDGMVQLKISGDASRVRGEVGRLFAYRPGELDRLVTLDSVLSLVLNMPDWKVQGLSLVASRAQLPRHEENHVAMLHSEVPIGLMTQQIFSESLHGAGLTADYRRLVPSGPIGPQTEAWVVLSLASTIGQDSRSFPFGIRIPNR
jgi:hypothetical protein